MKRITSAIKQSKIAIVGEAPGQFEMAKGIPFNPTGKSGYMLGRWLELNNIQRAFCFVTNVIGDRIGKVPTSSDINALYKELEFCKPKVILAVGKVAMESLTGYYGITKYRGSVIWNQSLKAKVIPCIHPSKVMKNYEYFPLCISDVGKLNNFEYERPKQNFIKEASNNDLEQFCAISVYHNLKPGSNSPVVVDVETIIHPDTHGYSHLVRIGLNNGDRSISIPMKNMKVSGLKAFRELMLNPNILKIGHNLSYDWMILLWNLYLMPVRPYFDTMIAWHAIEPELPKSLNTVASILTETIYWKNEKKGDKGLYNCLDVWNTYRIWERLDKLVIGTKYERIYSTMLDNIEPVVYMQMRGCKIDTEAKAKHDRYLEAKFNGIASSLSFNPSSSKQSCNYLYKELGLPKQYNWKVKDGKRIRVLTSDDKAVTRLYNKEGDQDVRDTLVKMLQARHYRKLRSTYVNTKLHNGRIKASFNIVAKEEL